MKKNTLVFLFALFPLIPAASRFAYGIVFSFSLIWLFFTGVLIKTIVKKITLSDDGLYIELVCLGGSATAFFLVLQGLFPVLSISLGLYVYITAFSYLLLTSIDYFTSHTKSIMPLMLFIPVLLLFSLLREILGFGTISFPVPSGLLEITLLPNFETYGVGFWGTAGGALILLGIIAWGVKHLIRKTSTFTRNT